MLKRMWSFLNTANFLLIFASFRPFIAQMNLVELTGEHQTLQAEPGKALNEKNCHKYMFLWEKMRFLKFFLLYLSFSGHNFLTAGPI